jgi:hypothetical protein
MSNILIRIKRAVLAGNLAFTDKAATERERDGLTELDVAESLINAVAIYKTIRSTNRRHRHRREYLHVIQSTNMAGIFIYTKGKLVEQAGVEVYYLLVSAKRAE